MSTPRKAAGAVAPATPADSARALAPVFGRHRRADRPFAEVADVLSPAEMDAAAAAITAWPEYTPTPLRALDGLAARLGLGAVLCKDESGRFGLGGVKALGAPYALARAVGAVGRGDGPDAPATGREAVAATDGNHGLALAWGARRVGATARIFVGNGVDASRLAWLRAAGAVVEAVDGTYDDAVDAAARHAAGGTDRVLVTDTDYTGGIAATRDVMAGYSVLGRELAGDLAEASPTHIVLQCGVGGMAAGVLAGLWQRLDRLDARVVLIEPVRAACLHASLAADREMAVGGALATRMVGLSCGRPSRPAWRILRYAAFAALAIDDADAGEAQAMLAAGVHGDPLLATGDTGVAGLAGLIRAAAPELRAALGLDAWSRVLVINSEPAVPPLPAPRA